MSWKQYRETRRMLNRLDRRIEQTPHDPMLHVRKGRVLDSLNRHAASLRELREAGRIFFGQQMYRHARAVYQMILERRAGDPIALRALQIIAEVGDEQLEPIAEVIDLDEAPPQDLHWNRDTPVDLWGVNALADVA